MNICLILLDDPYYLPKYIEKLFKKYRDEINRIVLLPARLPKESFIKFVKRLLGMYGFLGCAIQGVRMFWLKLLNIASVIFPFIPYRSLARLARKHGLKVVHVKNVNSPDFVAELKHQQVDLIISIAVPQLFKNSLMAVPKYRCINLHGAYLPYYRGCFSAFWVLLHEEKFTGATVHYITPEVDGGEILARENIPIEPKDCVDSLCRKTLKVGINLVSQAIELIRNGASTTFENPKDKAMYHFYPKKSDRTKFKKLGKKYFRFLY